MKGILLAGGLVNLGSTVQSFITGQIVPLGVTALFVGIVLIGGSFMAGKRAREWGKEHLFWMLIGAALVYSAASLAPSIAASLGGTGF